MPTGWRLLSIFIPWVSARLAWLVFPIMTNWSKTVVCVGLIADLVFLAWITWVVARVITQARQKRQFGLVAILGLLLVNQAIFSTGLVLDQLIWQGIALQAALFLIIGVVLIIGRRVLPFFIEKKRGVSVDKNGKLTGAKAQIRNSQILDKIAVVSFVMFAIAYLGNFEKMIISVLAVAVAVANAYRLIGWHHTGIWQKLLLWSLYLSFWGLVGGFLLMAILPWWNAPSSLGLHAVAISGIGLTTLAMMARVSLGHTGRNIHQPPKTVTAMFVLMIACLILRSIVPLLAADYPTVIAYAQFCWIVSFLLFLGSYTKMLINPRVDGIMG